MENGSPASATELRTPGPTVRRPRTSPSSHRGKSRAKIAKGAQAKKGTIHRWKTVRSIDHPHAHLSDSNRAAPGQGHVNFAAIMQALVDIDYRGYLTFELDAKAAVRSGLIPAEGHDDAPGWLMKQALEHTKRLESRLEAL